MKVALNLAVVTPKRLALLKTLVTLATLQQATLCRPCNSATFLSPYWT